MRKPSTEFAINGRKIGLKQPTYFIADIAANHDGDLSKAKDLIYLCKEAGAHAAKFQHFKAKSIVSDYGFKNLPQNNSHQAAWKKSVFDVYQDASLNPDWTPILKETCDKAGVTFFTSPYSFDLVDLVDPFVPAYKVGSGDITWTQIIEHMCKKGKPMLLACGASEQNEVDIAVESILKHTSELVLMQCNTNYTASLENFKYVNLNVIQTFKKKYPDMILGLSDHTPGHATVLGAVAFGARVVEKHFTDDNNRSGPDHKFAMNPKSWREMIDRTRELEFALGDGVKVVEENEQETVVLQRRCVRAARELAAGSVLKGSDLEVLRPAPRDGIRPYEMTEIIGRKLKRQIPHGDYLRRADLE